MRRQLSPFLTSLALLVTLLAPASLGHDDEGDDPPGSNPNGVSGRYVGSSTPLTPFLINEDDPIIIPNPLDPDAEPVYIIPSGPVSLDQQKRWTLCDFEVTHSGFTPVPADEILVDGVAAGGVFANAHFGAPSIPGPDALSVNEVINEDPEIHGLFSGWDDGGYAGACHSRFFDVRAYNTPGCPAGTAFAQDDVYGDVFIGAGCDWETQGGEDFDAGFFICLAHVPSANPFDCIAQLLGIASNIVTCALGQPTCGGGIGGDVCGGDGSADGYSYGWGNAGIPYPTGGAGHYGEDYRSPDDDGDNCLHEDTLALVVTVNAIEFPSGNEHVAVAGDIWQE